MIYVATTTAGLIEVLSRSGDDDSIWCGSDALSEQDFKALARAGLTRFTYPLKDSKHLADALATIEEHHPDEAIWIEAPASERLPTGPPRSLWRMLNKRPVIERPAHMLNKLPLTAC